jgi:peptide/nickel transport system permease protein
MAAWLLVMALAPWIAPHDAHDQFADRAYAPPMRIRFLHDGALRAPFVYAQRLDDRLLRRFSVDRSRPMTLQWFAPGAVVSLAPADGPLLLLGADALGRDVLSRLVLGSRLSLGVVALGALGALLVGTLAGAAAGAQGGALDRVLMGLADGVMVLPGAYVVLVLRGVLPPVLTAGQVFAAMSVLFALAAWPHAARLVRAVVAAERRQAWAEAARASGASRWRIARQLVGAARGVLAVEVLLVVPALLVAEATVSFLNLGFPTPSASWGTMLQEAANVRVMTEAPWLLAPAVAIVLVVWPLQLTGAGLLGRALLSTRQAGAR